MAEFSSASWRDPSCIDPPSRLGWPEMERQAGRRRGDAGATAVFAPLTARPYGAKG